MGRGFSDTRAGWTVGQYERAVRQRIGIICNPSVKQSLVVDPASPDRGSIEQFFVRSFPLWRDGYRNLEWRQHLINRGPQPGWYVSRLHMRLV
jgi:hypothetical protein